MSHAVIAGYVRSPFHLAHKGQLTKVRPDDLAAQVVRGLIDRTGIDPGELEDLLCGCAFPEGEQGLNVARLIGFLSDLPISVPGATVNRFCGSSMEAVHMAAGSIRMGAGEAFVCVGLESMTRVPIMGFNPLPHPGLYERYPQAYMSMGLTAETVAQRYDIPRGRQEELAVESQRKATAAAQGGRFADELVAIRDGDGQEVARDGTIRPDTTAEGLAELAPAFEAEGTVTAGTSSPLTDGAAACLVCSEAFAARTGLAPLARVRAVAKAGCAPEIMGMGPVHASRKALERAGIGVEDVPVVELNEAFAAQALACMDELHLERAQVNLDGGAIALGHPLGATGARITGKTASLMRREKARYGLATQCIGGGQGIATVLEAL